MEAYGGNVMMLCLVLFYISVIAGISHAIYKRTLKYIWIFGCIAGFCFFTVFRHVIVLLDYDDVTSPGYGAYKDWDVCRFVLSDIKRFFIWFGIGILNYIAFFKRGKQ